jgi:signal transduction histidine kinase
LLLIALVALCGAAVFVAVVLVNAKAASRSAALEADRLASLLSSSVKLTLQSAEAALWQAAGLIEDGATAPRAALATLLRRVPFIRSLSYLTPSGRVVLSIPETGPPEGAELGGLQVVSSAAAAADIRWSGVYSGLEQGRREISLAYGFGTGTLLAVVDFEALSAAIADLVSRADYGLALVDEGGGFIAHPDASKVERRELDRAFVAAKVRDPSVDSYRYKRSAAQGGGAVVASRIEGVGWYALVELPASFALATFLQSLPWAAVGAAVAIVLSGLLAGAASRRLIDDIRKAGAGDAAGEPGSGALFFRETEAIRMAAVEAASRIRAKDQANERLEALNVRLANTLDELSKAQAALVESERLAVRGTMAEAMAHELNSPIAAADSAAGSAASAASDILGYIAAHPGWDPDSAASAKALRAAAERYDPARALTGPDRRKASRRLEELLAKLSQAKGKADPAAARAPAETAPASLAVRLVDLGLESAGEREVAPFYGAAPEAALSCLSAAEIIASCRVARAAMAKAHSVVLTMKSAEPDRGGARSLDLTAAAEEALAMLYVRSKSGIRLELKADEGVRVAADPQAVQRLAMGLLANAMDAMGYRGRLGLRVYAKAGRAAFEVEDSGPDIPAALMGSLWSPGFPERLRAAGSARGGLELHELKEMAAAMGGDLQCASAPGRTIFTFYLPLEAAGA